MHVKSKSSRMKSFQNKSVMAAYLRHTDGQSDFWRSSAPKNVIQIMRTLDSVFELRAQYHTCYAERTNRTWLGTSPRAAHR